MSSALSSNQPNLNDSKENLRRLQEQQVQLKMKIESCRQKNDPSADALAILEAKAECIQVSINVLQANIKNAEDDIAKEEQADEVNVVDFSMGLNSPSAPLRPDKTAPAQTPQTPGEQKSICTELCNELHNELKKMHIEQMNMLQKIHQDTHQKHLKQQDLALKLAKEAKEHRTAIAKEAKWTWSCLSFLLFH